jgi:hypothetical protein
MISDLVEKEFERIRAKEWEDITQEEKNDLLRCAFLLKEIKQYMLNSDDPFAMLKSMALTQEDIELLERLDPEGTMEAQH